MTALEYKIAAMLHGYDGTSYSCLKWDVELNVDLPRAENAYSSSNATLLAAELGTTVPY